MSITADVLPLRGGAGSNPTFDVRRIRRDFPILRQKIHGKPLVYLDNAATTQKPQAVLDAIAHFYDTDCSNIHRGIHTLSQRATDAYEAARSKVQHFVNAANPGEIIFVRGTTEGVNLVAQTYGRKHVGAGDEIVVTAMEHHSNIVPWQVLCQEKHARLRVAPINDAGELLMDEFEKLLNPKTRLVAVGHVSNALGTINPVRQIAELAHRHDVPVLVDGAQAVPHLPIDVQALGCDFYAFSGHKVYGPTGIGVLYGREDLLEHMPPYQGGGEMISTVTFERAFYKEPPFRFEAGTPNVAGAIGLGAAIDYVTQLDRVVMAQYEDELLAYGTKVLSSVPGLRLIGTAREKTGVLSFEMDTIHPHDIGTILDREGVAIRTGHHCAQPLMERLRVPATARASLAFYNTQAEIDALVAGLHTVREFLG
jgi:cysteine desulfurase/selenocysteine lyase